MIKAILRFIRFPNLVIVALTQCLIYFRLLLPVFEAHGIQPVLPLVEFLLFVLVSLMVTAGGYIINDVFDYEADLINKPEKVILYKKISIRAATWLYFGISSIGFFLAVYLALYVGKPGLTILYPIAVGGLYLYSLWLKKIPLAGNLLIAIFAIVVAWIVPYSEYASMQQLAVIAPEQKSGLDVILWAYYLFAFYTTMLREVVKDIEDVEGDALLKGKTMPLLLGVKLAKHITLVFALALFFMVAFGAYFAVKYLDSDESVYVAMSIMIPLIASIYYLYRSQEKNDFHRVSQLLKILMLIGVLALFLF